jgi:hypothetical protein
MKSKYKTTPLLLDMPSEDQPTDVSIGLSVEEFNKIVEIVGSEMSYSLYKLLRQAVYCETGIAVE